MAKKGRGGSGSFSSNGALSDKGGFSKKGGQGDGFSKKGGWNDGFGKGSGLAAKTDQAPEKAGLDKSLVSKSPFEGLGLGQLGLGQSSKEKPVKEASPALSFGLDGPLPQMGGFAPAVVSPEPLSFSSVAPTGAGLGWATGHVPQPALSYGSEFDTVNAAPLRGSDAVLGWGATISDGPKSGPDASSAQPALSFGEKFGAVNAAPLRGSDADLDWGATIPDGPKSGPGHIHPALSFGSQFGAVDVSQLHDDGVSLDWDSSIEPSPVEVSSNLESSGWSPPEFLTDYAHNLPQSLLIEGFFEVWRGINESLTKHPLAKAGLAVLENSAIGNYLHEPLAELGADFLEAAFGLVPVDPANPAGAYHTGVSGAPPFDPEDPPFMSWDAEGNFNLHIPGGVLDFGLDTPTSVLSSALSTAAAAIVGPAITAATGANPLAGFAAAVATYATVANATFEEIDAAVQGLYDAAGIDTERLRNEGVTITVDFNWDYPEGVIPDLEDLSRLPNRETLENRFDDLSLDDLADFLKEEADQSLPDMLVTVEVSIVPDGAPPPEDILDVLEGTLPEVEPEEAVVSHPAPKAPGHATSLPTEEVVKPAPTPPVNEVLEEVPERDFGLVRDGDDGDDCIFPWLCSSQKDPIIIEDTDSFVFNDEALSVPPTADHLWVVGNRVDAQGHSASWVELAMAEDVEMTNFHRPVESDVWCGDMLH